MDPGRQIQCHALPDGLTLRVGDGVSDGVGQAFARAWDRAWSAVPSRFRGRLLAYWTAIQSRREAARRRRGASGKCRPPVPLIELVAKPLERFVDGGRRRKHLTSTSAVTLDDGAKFAFLAPYVGTISPAGVEALIAHELAHCVAFAMRHESPIMAALDAEVPEAQADSFALAWGFDADALDVDEATCFTGWSRGLPIKRKRPRKVL